MSNRILVLLSVVFIILSMLFFIHTGELFYAGLIFVNCCAVLCLLGRNRGFVLLFMIAGLIGMIFTAYQGWLYFS